MGGVVSSGQSNDDLIDNLLEADYIKTSDIERVFRAVDRAEYFLPEARIHAYKDLAWKTGNLHLSAPCIYSEVMEGLRLEGGLSFLNLGSGTGYLSTMVGLVLGSHGINHGIELHPDVIEYANKKLDDFKKHSGAVDEFDFCEPKFLQGNCLCLNNDGILYDRVYCGAACPESYEPYIKNLIKVGGILVMPLNDQLLQIKRYSENNWESRCLLPVSFASLIHPPENHPEINNLFEIEPPSLQALCRSKIRTLLRKMVESEHPPIKKSPSVNKAPKKKRALRRCVVAVFESDESSDEEGRVRGQRNNQEYGRAVLHRDDFFNFVLESIETRNLTNSRIHPERPTRRRRNQSNEANKADAMDTDTNDSNDENERNTNANKTEVEVEVHPSRNSSEVPSQVDTENEPSEDAKTKEGTSANDSQNEPCAGASSAQISTVNSDSTEKVSENPEAKTNKREKFDSGLGDEIVETQNASSSENDEEMVEMQYEGDDENSNNGRRVRKVPTTINWMHRGSSTNSSEDDMDNCLKRESGLKMYKSPYSEYMRVKIQELPLPSILKRYLNFYREF